MSKYVSQPKYQVGDKVWVPLAVDRECGVVKEDRGNLGIGGRRLYYVDVSLDPYTHDRHLVGEDEMQPYDEKDVKKISSEEIVKFLTNVGLVSMLRRNLPNRVWLRRNSAGNVSYTYLEEFGEIGGQHAPLYVLMGDKISKQGEDQVRQFIESFGLSKAQVQHVLQKVGVAS